MFFALIGMILVGWLVYLIFDIWKDKKIDEAYDELREVQTEADILDVKEQTKKLSDELEDRRKKLYSEEKGEEVDGTKS